MNFTVLPARSVCNRCSNVGKVDAEYCTACGVSFVFGKTNQWESKALMKDVTTLPLQAQVLESVLEIELEDWCKLKEEYSSTQQCLWASIQKKSGQTMLSCSYPICSPPD